MIATATGTAAELARAIQAYPTEITPRLVLADYWTENDRPDVAAMWCGTLPERKRTRERVDSLTDAERKRMPAWVKKWVKIGLSTAPADRPMFEAAVTQCYLATGLNPPRVVWCANPLVTVLAASMYLLKKSDAVGDAVGGAVGGAVDDAVRDAVRGAVGGAETLNLYWHYMGGQFWVGGYWWGAPAFVSFMLDVLRLKLPDHLELAARAYAATASSACWWWPHRDVVFVSERPHTIEIRNSQKPRVQWDGWGIG